MSRQGPEKALESRILDWLNSIKGCFAIKINTTGTFDPKRKILRTITNPHIHKGTSDILGLYRGRFFAIEVKAGYNKASNNQKLFIERVIEAGGVAWVSNNFQLCKGLFITEFGPVEYKPLESGDSLLFDEEL